MKMIWVTFRKAGLHFYPLAGTQGLEDVDYLRMSHRHLFHFKVAIEVFHDDRELEFHQFLKYLEKNVTTESLNNKSCEMIAEDIFNTLKYQYKHKTNARTLIVDVSEDGECGVTAEFVIEKG